MTWLDLGIGTCACGVERRLYRPERIDEAMCCMCAQRWSVNRLLNDQDLARHNAQNVLKEGRAHVRRLIQARRDRLAAAGLCVDCGREPRVNGTLRGKMCREKQIKRCAEYGARKQSSRTA